MEIEQIEDNIRTNFKVTQIPVGDLKKFKRYCRDECGNVYSVGIIQLLKTKQQYEDLIPIISSLFKRLDEMEEKINKIQTKPERAPLRTFGE